MFRPVAMSSARVSLVRASLGVWLAMALPSCSGEDQDVQAEPSAQPSRAESAPTSTSATPTSPATGSPATTSPATSVPTSTAPVPASSPEEQGASEVQAIPNAEQTSGASGASSPAVAPGADPDCEGGLIAGTSCCPLECGECAGAGCGSRPGGAENCCSGAIQDSARLCSEVGPPCIIGDLPPPPPPDPECATGVAAGTNCCPLECGTCGGPGCGSRPGGADNCCSEAIQAAGVLCSGSAPPCILAEPVPPQPPDPDCATGVAAGTTCCVAVCGECAGAGCGSRPGGAANCCSEAIVDSGRLCSESAPPCILTP